jgi:hypothetical protein
MLPPPVSVMPVIVNGAAVFVNATLPLVVFVALKLETALAPFNVEPPTELVVNSAPLIKPAPLSVNAPLEVREILLLLPAAMLPVILIAPVLLTDTAPVPFCMMLVIVSGAAVSFNEMTPAPLFVALKLVTVFALPNVVPNAELVVSKPPIKKPAPASFTVPAVPVREIAPVVLRPPAFNIALRPAVALNAPDPLPTFALNKISLVAPVAAKVTKPEPFAITVLPNVSVPLAFSVMLPLVPVLIAPLVVSAPVLFTTMLPPPVSAMPVIVNGAAVFVNATLPLVVFVALKLETALAPFKVAPPTELVVNNAPLIKPEPLSANVPLEVRETLLVPAVIPPVILKLPVLPTDTLPAPVWAIPVIAKVAAVFVRDNAPPLFVALKLVTVFAPPSVSPPTELVVSNAPLIKPAPLSIKVPLEVRETLLVPAVIPPVILNRHITHTGLRNTGNR